ncbi:MAG: protein kinase, partial [Psychroserpens sp.]|nr:protein kinase [Psychroserpens sp.]
SAHRHILTEINALSYISGDIFVKLLATFKDKPEALTPSLVLEYVPGNTLSYLLHQLVPPALPNYLEKTAVSLQIFKGLSYLHSRNWIHRDIKTSNLLPHPQNISDGNSPIIQDYIVKICDFGLTTQIPEGAASIPISVGDNCGSISYAAPESFCFSAANVCTISYSYDIWSGGITLNETFGNKRPYHEVHDRNKGIIQSIVQGGGRPEISSTLPLRVISLIKYCTFSNPSERFTAPEVVAALEELYALFHQIHNDEASAALLATSFNPSEEFLTFGDLLDELDAIQPVPFPLTYEDTCKEAELANLKLKEQDQIYLQTPLHNPDQIYFQTPLYTPTPSPHFTFRESQSSLFPLKQDLPKPPYPDAKVESHSQLLPISNSTLYIPESHPQFPIRNPPSYISAQTPDVSIATQASAEINKQSSVSDKDLNASLLLALDDPDTYIRNGRVTDLNAFTNANMRKYSPIMSKERNDALLRMLNTGCSLSSTDVNISTTQNTNIIPISQNINIDPQNAKITSTSQT